MSRADLGMPSFPIAAEHATRDSQLRHNIRNATRTIRKKRVTAVEELADWPQLREAGASIKDQALRHLDHHLEQLEAQVTAAGGQVHWARDADEATRTVTDLVLATGETEVVKVKSMATQEIGLNEALHQAGITAYETDLAELIVQLACDTPSHILVPAIHRNRSEIRRIFLAEMGRWGRPAPQGLTDEPADLAEAARLHLRDRFLRTKVGISGANFMVAESGTLVVVESEGNGRMCLTLPDTLISVVGIEKIVPTWQDLEVFLQLLPRSSTAERMNPYTSMWTGVTERDGPQTFHLVLLDNGRTRTLADKIGRQALRCIRCSACLNVCPVYERVGGHAYGSVYPGPIGAILGPQLRGTSTPLDASLPYASSLCGACFDVCPVAIDIPEVLVHLRERVVGGAKTIQSPATGKVVERAAMNAAYRVMTSPRLFTLALRAATRTRKLVPRRIPLLGAWTDTRDLPRLPTESFRDWWYRTRGESQLVTSPSIPTVKAPKENRIRNRLHRKPTTQGPSEINGSRQADTARKHILQRIQQALADVPAAERPVDVKAPRSYFSAHLAADQHVVLNVLKDRITEYGATVHHSTLDELPALLERVVHEHGTRRVAVPDGLPADWLTAINRDVELVVESNGLTCLDLDRVDAVIGSCACTIAETGTIVLDGAPGQGRRMLSLVPDHHICVVRTDQVVASVPHAITRLDSSRPQTWISGPSATSDIELQRVAGVHGPRKLDVVLLDADSKGSDGP